MSLEEDTRRVRSALERIADPTEHERVNRAFDRILTEIHEMKSRIDTARASLADMRDELEQQMEFWRPKQQENDDGPAPHEM